MSRFFHRLRHDVRAASAVEYGLIAGLIFLAMVGAVAGVADSTISMWNRVSTRVDQTTPQ